VFTRIPVAPARLQTSASRPALVRTDRFAEICRRLKPFGPLVPTSVGGRGAKFIRRMLVAYLCPSNIDPALHSRAILKLLVTRLRHA
jgi:hypothetical protein